MKIKTIFISLVLSFLLLPLVFAAAPVWESVSSGIPDQDIRWIEKAHEDAKTLYAASARRLYKSSDDGISWSQVFTLWGFSHEIQKIYCDPQMRRTIYVAATNGVWASKDAGKTWNLFFQGSGGDSRNVFCVSAGPAGTGDLWLGTMAGRQDRKLS